MAGRGGTSEGEGESDRESSRGTLGSGKETRMRMYSKRSEANSSVVL